MCCSSTFLQAALPVFYLNHPADRVLALGCPGARSDMAVAWDQGSVPIYRSEHSAGGNLSTRLLIDTGHHLVFKPAKAQDSGADPFSARCHNCIIPTHSSTLSLSYEGVYYCWLQGHKAAEIHLLVYAHLGQSQSVTAHPDFQTAVRTVLTFYAAMTAAFCLLVFVRAGVRTLRDRSST